MLIDLRQKIGRHAHIIKTIIQHDLTLNLRTKIGHKPTEIIGGLFIGAFVVLLIRRY